MILDVEFSLDQMLYLLFFPGLSLTEEFKKLLLLLFAELRGLTAPEVRRE